MSKVGKRNIVIPSGTSINWDTQSVVVKGPLGEIVQKLDLHDFILLEKDGILTVGAPAILNKRTRSLWGTVNSVISNMVSGVNRNFEKILEFEGVGYRAEVAGRDLVLNLGFSHPIKLLIPEGLEIATTKNSITISGKNKELVGLFAAKIRKIRKIEPFKLSGIRYKGEIVKKKAGKKLAG